MSAVGGKKFDQLTIACFLVEITSKQEGLSMMIRIRDRVISSKGGQISKRRAPVRGGIRRANMKTSDSNNEQLRIFQSSRKDLNLMKFLTSENSNATVEIGLMITFVTT